MISSLSGIRGAFNRDLGPDRVPGLAAAFSRAVGSEEFLLARDSRTTGPAMSRAAAAGLLGRGATVHDFGVISTPALFRESRTRGLPAIMVTASHNEPEFTGLKFIVDGAGVGKDILDEIVSEGKKVPKEFGRGTLKQALRTSYADDLVAAFGSGAGAGIKVAADFGGGAAVVHAIPVLSRLGCEVFSLNDTPGVFTRKVDPVADDLSLLRNVVKVNGCDIGLGFDCDGDRLVIVGPDGKKRTGDQMLVLALSELLAQTGEKKVVVSQDTTRAVDDIAEERGCEVYRSRVGEANVVRVMKEHNARLGGEGSSGGLIDGSFNYCRDSMLAALAIIRAIKSRGRKFYDSAPSYHQSRVALQIPRTKARRALGALSKEYPEGDLRDGLKISLPKRSWVLVRPSGTENVVRVSAEATTARRAEQLANSFVKKLKGLSR